MEKIPNYYRIFSEKAKRSSEKLQKQLRRVRRNSSCWLFSQYQTTLVNCFYPTHGKHL